MIQNVLRATCGRVPVRDGARLQCSVAISLAAQTAFFFLHWVEKKGLAKWSIAIGHHYAEKISACEPMALEICSSLRACVFYTESSDKCLSERNGPSSEARNDIFNDARWLYESTEVSFDGYTVL